VSKAARLLAAWTAHQRVAAYGDRTFNGGFLAMNLGARLSQPGRQVWVEAV